MRRVEEVLRTGGWECYQYRSYKTLGVVTEFMSICVVRWRFVLQFSCSLCWFIWVGVIILFCFVNNLDVVTLQPWMLGPPSPWNITDLDATAFLSSCFSSSPPNQLKPSNSPACQSSKGQAAPAKDFNDVSITNHEIKTVVLMYSSLLTSGVSWDSGFDCILAKQGALTVFFGTFLWTSNAFSETFWKVHVQWNIFATIDLLPLVLKRSMNSS